MLVVSVLCDLIRSLSGTEALCLLGQELLDYEKFSNVPIRLYKQLYIQILT